MEDRVSFRIKRQRILHRDHPVPCRVVIHEAALHMRFGGPETSKAQLGHLIDMSRRDHMTIRVIPFSNGVFPGSGQSVNYFHGPVQQLDTVLLEQSHGSLLLDTEAQLEKYRLVIDKMESVALKPDESRDFIHSLAQAL